MAEMTQPISVLPIRSKTTMEVLPSEWRWVIVVSGLLTFLTLLPYIWAFGQTNSASPWQFNGILVNPADGATYLAKIAEGMRGQWLFTIAHTPEATPGTFLFEFYLLLGHVGNLIGLSPVLIFHVARIAATLVMYLAFYALAAEIWQQRQARRLFFLILSAGSGIGWLALLLAPSLKPVDLYVPEAFPFYSSFLTPHFPTAFALLAVLIATFIHILRPGHLELPTFANGGIIMAVGSLGLAIVLPQAWLPLISALILYTVSVAIEKRRLPEIALLRWLLLAIVPAVLIPLYDYAIANLSPLYAIWNAQNQTLAGSPLNYVFGYCLLLIVALPAIIQTVQRREHDGDRLMLIWLVITIVLIYLPTNIQRRFSTDLIIPLVYFATRAIFGFWATRIRRARQRALAWIILFVPILISNALILVLPLHGLSDPQAGLQADQLITTDYAHALSWLHDRSTANSVILAPPSASLWIPAATGARVVYGHPLETLNADSKLAQVKAWYAGQNCTAVLSAYHVAYVLVGTTGTVADGVADPYATSPCVSLLGSPVATFNTVTVYDTSHIDTF